MPTNKIPDLFEIFCPYPDDTVMTDEAVAGMVDTTTKVVMSSHSAIARITKAVNKPLRNGYTLELKVEK